MNLLGWIGFILGNIIVYSVSEYIYVSVVGVVTILLSIFLINSDK